MQGFPALDAAPETHPKVQELRAWTDGVVAWCGVEFSRKHGSLT